MGKGVIEISGPLFDELITTALHLPDDMKVDGISAHYIFDKDIIAIKVEHEDIPSVEPGTPLPKVELTYEKHCDVIADEVILSGWTTIHGSCAAPVTYEDIEKMFKGL